MHKAKHHMNGITKQGITECKIVDENCNTSHKCSLPKILTACIKLFITSIFAISIASISISININLQVKIEATFHLEPQIILLDNFNKEDGKITKAPECKKIGENSGKETHQKFLGIFPYRMLTYRVHFTVSLIYKTLTNPLNLLKKIIGYVFCSFLTFMLGKMEAGIWEWLTNIITGFFQ